MAFTINVHFKYPVESPIGHQYLPGSLGFQSCNKLESPLLQPEFGFIKVCSWLGIPLAFYHHRYTDGKATLF